MKVIIIIFIWALEVFGRCRGIIEKVAAAFAKAFSFYFFCATINLLYVWSIRARD